MLLSQFRIKFVALEPGAVCSSLTSDFEVYLFDLNIAGFGGHFSVSGVSQAETTTRKCRSGLVFICSFIC